MGDTTTTQPASAHCAYCPTTISPRPGAPDCAFCAIVAGTGEASVVRRWDNVIAIRPRADQQGRRGVTDGHILIIPHVHVADAGVDPAVSGLTMACAAELAGELDAFNIITSKGPAATQSVFHLHIHLVPRVLGDGLLLPWTPPPAIHLVIQPELGSWNVALRLDRAAA